MGAAKNRKAEIAALNAKAKTNDLVDFMFSFGDGGEAVNARSQVLGAVATMISTGFNRFCYNASLGKTTHCEGIQLNGENVDDFDVSIGDPVVTAMIIQDLIANCAAGNGDLKLAGLAMYADKLTNRMSPSVCYVHAKGTMVVSKWRRGAIVEFIPADTVNQYYSYSSAKDTIDKMMNFMQ